MSGLSDESRALIALHLAALRRHGWTAAQSLWLIAQGVPAGDDQRALEALAAALGRGEKPAPGADPFLALLAQGEAAGPEALAESVKSSQLTWAATHSWRQAAVMLSAVAVGVSIAGFFSVMLVRAGGPGTSFDGSMPALTQLALQVIGGLGYFGPLLLLALAVVPWVVPRRWLPGVRRYQSASLLRQFCAAVAAALPIEAAGRIAGAPGSGKLFDSPALGLGAIERRAGEFLLAREGAEAGARTLAAELEAEAGLTTARFAGWAPVVGLAALLLAVLPVVFALFLPMFSMAGAIR